MAHRFESAYISEINSTFTAFVLEIIKKQVQSFMKKTITIIYGTSVNSGEAIY